MAVTDEVLVVGAGIAGVSCARALADAGVPVVVRDRGHRIGGRMAVRTLEGRPIDVGAAYFTARHPDFRAVVDRWVADELAHPWTDTFHLGTPDGLVGTTTGPLRYATALGLRSLVEHLAVGLPVVNPDDVAAVAPGRGDEGPVVDGEPYAAVALAMPGPQALDLLDAAFADERTAADRFWEPSLSLVTRWTGRSWPDLDGVFVNDSPVLTWIADDGRRRGDDAPILVAHGHPVLAAQHLDDPAGALPVMLAEQATVLGMHDEPETAWVQRWSLAKPAEPRDEPFFLGTGRVGLCGDGWHGSAKIESAALSGRALGRALARLLGASPRPPG
jgi:renalase